MKNPNLFKRRKSEIPFSQLRKMLDYYPPSLSAIDPITWADLNMDDVYAQMEETLTAQGDEALYYSLHNPIFDPKQLQARTAAVQALTDHSPERDQLRENLKKTGRLRYDFRRSIQEDFQLSAKDKLLYRLGPLALLLLTGLMLVTRNWNLILWLLACILFNGVLHYKFSKKYEAQIDTLAYTYKLLNFCRLYRKNPFFREYGLDEYYPSLRQTHQNISFIFQLESLDFVADYLNILFLFKERRYVSIAKKLAPKADLLFRLYEISGQMDMHQAMSVFFTENTKPVCTPVFVGRTDKLIRFKQLIHPLLEAPVANDLEIKTSLIITGSNMSGKSTFLRTLGVNVLLAQTWNFAYAAEMTLCPLHIITSISLQDSISEGKSYF